MEGREANSATSSEWSGFSDYDPRSDTALSDVIVFSDGAGEKAGVLDHEKDPLKPGHRRRSSHSSFFIERQQRASLRIAELDKKRQTFDSQNQQDQQNPQIRRDEHQKGATLLAAPQDRKDKRKMFDTIESQVTLGLLVAVLVVLLIFAILALWIFLDLRGRVVTTLNGVNGIVNQVAPAVPTILSVFCSALAPPLPSWCPAPS
jgi:hypothetical protein